MSIEAVFDASAHEYDRVRRILIPCFDDFYRTAVEVVPFRREDAIRVLDLGAGTGLMSSFVLAAYPEARLTLVDVSAEMLARARERFSPLGERVTFALLDYARSALPGHYDLIVSALSIHHLADEDKVALYSRAFDALEAGGILVNADQVRGSTERGERLNRETWVRRIHELGIRPEEYARARERMRYDQMADLESQLRWLRSAGFVDVDCHYKWYSFAVFGGRKAYCGSRKP